DQLPDAGDLPAGYPFTPEQIERIAKTEPTLRDMLQQFRQLYDRVVFGAKEEAAERPAAETPPALRVPELAGAGVKAAVLVREPNARGAGRPSPPRHRSSRRPTAPRPPSCGSRRCARRAASSSRKGR